MPVIELNAEEFNAKVIQFIPPQEDENGQPVGGMWIFVGDKPALINFYAPDAEPCKTVEPILNELADEFDGKIDFYKVNTLKEVQLSRSYGITAVPSMLLVSTEEDSEPMMIAGAVPKDAFYQAFEKELGLTKE